MPTAPSARRIIEMSFLRIIKCKNFALRRFIFRLFLQFLLKIFFDSMSLSPSRSKIQIFGCNVLLTWLPLIIICIFTSKCNYRFAGGEPMLGLSPIIKYPWYENGTQLFPFRTMSMLLSMVSLLGISHISR